MNPDLALPDLANLLFWLKKSVSVLLLPPLMPVLPVIAGLLLMPRHPRLGRGLAWSGVALNLLLIAPFSVSWLVGLVEYRQPLDQAAARRAQALIG